MEIKKETIEKTVNFLNDLSGNTFSTTKEINEVASEHEVRQGLQRFAKELNWCHKNSDNEWVFIEFNFHPNHARQIIEMSNEYNRSCNSNPKKQSVKKEKSKTTTDNSIQDSNVGQFISNILQKEIDAFILENNLEDNVKYENKIMKIRLLEEEIKNIKKELLFEFIMDI